MENVAIKGRGGNGVQYKNWKGKILRIWITIIRHGGLGHEVQESWPYLSNATPWPYELSHVKNEAPEGEAALGLCCNQMWDACCQRFEPRTQNTVMCVKLSTQASVDLVS